MATAHLVASAYTRSSSNRVSVTSPENMYDPVSDSSNYATLRGRNNSNSTYYCFIHGFNFSSIPSGATINSFSVKINAYRSSNQRTGTSYNVRLASSPSSNSVISNTTATTAIGTSATTITIPTGSLTWSQITGYGSNFSIDVVLASNSSSYPYVYVYGAEIEVDYSLPVYYDVTASTDSGSVSPSGTTSVIQGGDFTLTINVPNPTVRDNNVDVTSQIERITGGTETFVPYDYESSGFTISSISNAYTDISGSSSADCSLAGRTTGNLYLELGPISIPSGATITGVTCQASLQISRNGSSSSMTASCQMYSGNTAKGSATTLVSSATDVARTTYNLTVGSWTASELQNARLYVTMYNGASSTVRYVYVFGVSLTVTYTVSGEVYSYTIHNVAGNHTIVVSAGSTGAKIFIKQNGSWVQYSKVYKKVNGSWVEQSSSNWSDLFDTSTVYVHKT